jgi:hypothetical protein
MVSQRRNPVGHDFRAVRRRLDQDQFINAQLGKRTDIAGARIAQGHGESQLVAVTA